MNIQEKQLELLCNNPKILRYSSNTKEIDYITLPFHFEVLDSSKDETKIELYYLYPEFKDILYKHGWLLREC